MKLEKKYWLSIYPYVYVSFMDNRKMILYNTRKGSYIETESLNCIEIIKKICLPNNLGVIELIYSDCQRDIISFIKEIIRENIGYIIEKTDNSERPINLLPILNLQKDIDKLILQNQNQIGSEIISYLSELNIVINNACFNSCKYCDLYYKQTKCCYKKRDNNVLSIESIKTVLSQLELSHVDIVNILGGDISFYPYWKTFLDLIYEYDFEFQFWIQYNNYMRIELDSRLDMYKINIMITFPVDMEDIIKLKEICNAKKNIQFHFLITDEKVYIEAADIIKNLELSNANIIPIYTGNNIDFFENNIYLQKEDIFSDVIEMRKIFCNQKLNANHFGILTILSNGEVRANINSDKLGNIHNDSILEILYKELINNTAWRKVRSQEPCNNCLYRFLCPPPSNYEMIIQKPNLCHVHP